MTFATGFIDLLLAVLFAAAYVKTSPERVTRESAFGLPPRGARSRPATRW
jgi:hypothetical protein